jgi:hypothetical protein
MRISDLIFLASAIAVAPIATLGQGAADVAQSRTACAQGLGQQALNRAQMMGFRMGLSDLCVKALDWSATNGKLLDLYSNGNGQSNARLIVNTLTDKARTSTGPFRPTGSAEQMWSSGELTPSLAFDAGFTRSFLEKKTPSSGQTNMAALESRTEGCLTENQPLAVCVEVGRVQGALAYQTNAAFGDSRGSSAPKSASKKIDRAQVESALDEKFQAWSRSWSWDRYNIHSASVDGVDCSGQCKASGKFMFNRLGTFHTIHFVAFIQIGADGGYSVERLCYDDPTSNSRDCTD